MSGGLAMKMRLELSQLARRHGVTPGISCALPLADPSARPVTISGIAAAPTVDQERMAFAPHALMYLPWKLPRLMFRHREPAGQVLSLAYDAHGRLILDARVDHPEGRRTNGLSVCATIQRYEIIDADDPQRFHALITRADLDAGEISLTPTPCNSDCVVTLRLPTSPALETFDLVRQGFDKAREIIEVLRQQLREPPSQPVPRHPRAASPPRHSAEPRSEPQRAARASDFSRLVEAMQENSHV